MKKWSPRVRFGLNILLLFFTLFLVYPKTQMQAMGDDVKVKFTRTPTHSRTPTRTVTSTPTITPTPTITLTATPREGTHVPEADVEAEITVSDKSLGPVSYSSDGKYLAVGFDGGIKIYSLKDLSLRKSIKLVYSVDNLAFSPDGKFLAATSHYTGLGYNAKYIANLWETTQWHIVTSATDGGGAMTALAWDANSRIFIVGRDTVDKNKSAIFLWYTNGLAASWLESPPVTSLAMSNDNKYLVAGGKDGYVYVYDFFTGTILYRMRARTTAITGIVFYKPDWITVSNAAGYLSVWKNEKELFYEDDLAVTSGLSMSPDRRAVAFCSRYGQMINFDFTSEDTYYSDGDNRCSHTAFSPDGTHLAVSFTDGKIRIFPEYSEGIWKATTNPKAVPTVTLTYPKSTAQPLPTLVKGALRSSNATQIKTIASGVLFKVFLTAYKQDISYPSEFHGLSGTTWIALSNDNNLEATLNNDAVQIVNHSERTTYSLKGNGSRMNAIAFSPTEDLVAGGAMDGSVFIWNSKTSEMKCQIFTTPVQVKAIQFNHSGSMFAVGYDNQDIELYQVNGCNRLILLPKTTRLVNDLDFSPDDQKLASAAADTSAQVFDLLNQKLIRHLEPDHNIRGLNSVAYNADQSLLAAGGNEGILTIWNPNSREFLIRIHIGTKSNPITTLLFSKDSTQIFVCLKDKTCTILGLDNK